MKKKHVLLRDLSLVGWEYGMLRSLEQEIVERTGATIVNFEPAARVKWFCQRLPAGWAGRVLLRLMRKTSFIDSRRRKCDLARADGAPRDDAGCGF